MSAEGLILVSLNVLVIVAGIRLYIGVRRYMRAANAHIAALEEVIVELRREVARLEHEAHSRESE